MEELNSHYKFYTIVDRNFKTVGLESDLLVFHDSHRCRIYETIESCKKAIIHIEEVYNYGEIGRIPEIEFPLRVVEVVSDRVFKDID